MMKYSSHINKMLSSVPVLLTAMLALSACGNDEPDWYIGYYLSIDSQVSLSLTEEDEHQGTMPDMGMDVLSNAVRRMRATLLETYPQDDHQGNDALVVAALDNIYVKYKKAYGDYEGVTVCVCKLYRTKKVGGVVKESTALKSYHFGLLPVNVVPVDIDE